MVEQSRVLLLDEGTVNRIAAGEVVERPASVVKELVENSLDAGARRILVQIEDGGRKLVRVLDDGFGMNRAEAVLALQRHATSKIKTASDLFKISTLGFRGEGLPSIASVSVLELLTKAPQEEAGFRILVNGGAVVEATETGAADGTSVTVKDLFFNTPARLKFMKSHTTEMSHIVDLVAKYAMAYPDVAFRLQHGGQDVIVSPGSGDALGAVAAVWGKEIARALAPLDFETAGVRVTGFISPPHITRPTRSYQAFFVNHRPVRTRTLVSALDEAYRSLTPEKRFPIALIKLELDPDKVDVNVHPTKIEVKFQREGDIFHAVHSAIKEGLKAHGMMPEAFRSMPRPQPAGWSAPTSSPGPDWGTVTQAAVQAFAPAFAEGTDDDLFGPGTTPEPRSPSGNALPFADLLPGLRILGQVQNTYIVCETQRGVVLIDQHVAHERVLYERFCGIKGARAIEQQRLLTPITITLDRRAALLLNEKLDEINQLGFELESFGADAFLLRAVPAALADKNYEELLRDMVDELVDASVAKRLPVAREQIWITASCKQAVKAGDPLTMQEMEALIHQLAETENPYLCPHGRPITITLTREEIERKFKRS